MTISTTSARIVHTGDNSSVDFTTNFKFLAGTDLRVILHHITAGTDTLQSLTTHYSVTGEGDTTGTVTFVTAPTTDYKVVIVNDTPITQLVDYLSGDTFPAETHEGALDRVTIQQSRTRDMVERTPRLADGDVDGSGGYNASGYQISNINLTPSALSDATSKSYVDSEITSRVLAGSDAIPTGASPVAATKPSGPDLTARTLADRWGDYLSILDFGAVSFEVDSGTANGLANTTAINDAITRTALANKKLHVPAGTFFVTNLNIQTNTSIFGEGTIKRANSDLGGQMVVANNVNNFSIEGITLDGNKAGAVSSSFVLWITAHCYSAVVDGVTVINGASTGINVSVNVGDRTQGTQSYIRNCVVRDCNNYGIGVVDAKDITVVGNLVENVAWSGIFVYGYTTDICDMITIDGNTVVDSARTGINIAMNGPTPPFSNSHIHGVSRVQVVNNKVRSSAWNGISVQSNGGVVANNISTDNGTLIGHQGLLMNGNNLTITGNTSTGNAGTGLDIGNTSYCTATGNQITDNGLLGIEVGGTIHTVVDSNFVKNNLSGDGTAALTSGQSAGILVWSGVDSTVTGVNLGVDPIVITTGTKHAFADGQLVKFHSVGGTTQLNGNEYTVAEETDYTFELLGVAPAGYSAFTTGGEVGHIASDIVISNNIVIGGSDNHLYGVSVIDTPFNVDRVSIIGNGLAYSGFTRAININSDCEFTCKDNILLEPDLPSGTSLEVDQNRNFAYITGDVAIHSIVTDTGKYESGRMLTLLFNGTPAVVSGAKLKLDGNFRAAAGVSGSLTLMSAYNGDWHEISRMGKATTNTTMFPVLPAADTTPSVAGGKYFNTLVSVTVTDFDDGQVGQEITIMAQGVYTIVNGTPIKLNGDLDFKMKALDNLSLIKKDDGKWHETARMIYNPLVTTFAVDDVTPSVGRGMYFLTAGGTAITDFDDGEIGQTIMIKAKSTIRITDGGDLELEGNFNMNAGDTITLTMFEDTKWSEISRSET